MRYYARTDDTYSDEDLSRTFRRQDMANASPENHAAAAWVAGQMAAAQRREFEAHLATCTACQAEVAALLAQQPRSPGGARRPIVQIAIAVILTLTAGFALGWSVWELSHH